MKLYRYFKNTSTHTLSFLVLCYGLYSVLCQVGMIWLHTLFESHLPAYLLAHRYAPMLEYSMMSLLILCVGAVLMQITCRSEGKS